MEIAPVIFWNIEPNHSDFGKGENQNKNII